jgi:hypothetical protein
MLLSKEDMFGDAQTIATAQGATNSSDTLDWGAHGDDISRFLSLFVLCKNTAASDGAATLSVALQTSSNGTDFATIQTWNFALADLDAGAYLVNGVPLPPGVKRYNKLVYTGGTADFTTAPILTAGIVRNDVPVARQTT